MKKIISKENNALELDVFINGEIDITAIPINILDLIVTNLEKAISKLEEN